MEPRLRSENDARVLMHFGEVSQDFPRSLVDGFACRPDPVFTYPLSLPTNSQMNPNIRELSGVLVILSCVLLV